MLLDGGRTTPTPYAALALMETVGWDAVCARARRELQAVLRTAVLAGVSMSAGGGGSCGRARYSALAMIT